MDEELKNLPSGRFPLFIANFVGCCYLALAAKIFIEKGFLYAALVFVITWILKRAANLVLSMIYANFIFNKSADSNSSINPFEFERGRFWIMIISECVIFAISVYILWRYFL